MRKAFCFQMTNGKRCCSPKLSLHSVSLLIKKLGVIYLEMKHQNLKHIANGVLLLNDCGSITSSLILDIILSSASNSSCRWKRIWSFLVKTLIAQCPLQVLKGANCTQSERMTKSLPWGNQGWKRKKKEREKKNIHHIFFPKNPEKCEKSWTSHSCS